MIEDQNLSTTRRKHFITNLLKILISGVLLVWLLHGIGLNNIFQQLTTANWLWVILAVVIFSVSNVLGAVQWYLLLRSLQVGLSLGHVVSFYHVGLFFNNFLIGYVGGDALRIYDVARQSGNSTVAVSSVIFDRFIGFFVLTSIAMVVSLFQIQQLTSFKAVYFIGFILFAWILIFVVLFNKKIGTTVGRIFQPITPQFIVNKVHDIYVAINHFRQHRLMLLQVFGISIIVQTFRILVHYIAALSVGVNTSPIYFFMFIPLVALFASLPISFGGIGVREQSGVTLFSTIGLAASKVVTFEFLAYIVGIVATIPGGVIFALRREELSFRLSKKNITTEQQAPDQNGGE